MTQSKNGKIKVGVIMGSSSDYETMKNAEDILESFGVAYEIEVVSAHRTPEKMYEYAKSAEERGLQCIIAAAGGAAHLPGMVSSMTPLPVLGVPIGTLKFLPPHYKTLRSMMAPMNLAILRWSMILELSSPIQSAIGV